MVVAGPLYRNNLTRSVWAEVGATAMTGPFDPGVGEAEPLTRFSSANDPRAKTRLKPVSITKF